MKRIAYWLYTAACALAIAFTLLSAAHGSTCPGTGYVPR